MWGNNRYCLAGLSWKAQLREGLVPDGCLWGGVSGRRNEAAGRGSTVPDGPFSRWSLSLCVPLTPSPCRLRAPSCGVFPLRAQTAGHSGAAETKCHPVSPAQSRSQQPWLRGGAEGPGRRCHQRYTPFYPPLLLPCIKSNLTLGGVPGSFTKDSTGGLI